MLSPAEQDRVAERARGGRRGDEQRALAPLLEGQPEDVQAEIIRINTDVRRSRCRSRLLVPLLAALLGCSIVPHDARAGPGVRWSGRAQAASTIVFDQVRSISDNMHRMTHPFS